MLAPQSNASRTILDFSGVWDFRLKPDAPWQSIAVPASYNDQSADPEFRRHVGLAWYRRSITVPSMLKGQRLMLRFDAVTHNARVFLDGQLLCTHRGGFLPFEADVTDILHPGQTALLEVEVDNTISHHTLPVGNEGGTAFFGSDNPGIPSVEAGKQHQHEQGINLPNFDFFNYAGLNRPVRLYTTPADYIADVTLIPSMDGTVRYTVVTHGEGDVTLDVLDADGQVVASGTGASGEVHVANPHLWEPAPGVPYLYTARVRFGQDEYSQPFGIREIKVDGCRFLINCKPFHFHGPCKHEDSFFHGRGLDQCLNVTDINLFHWLHANAFRTSHYPYSEEMLSLCDREGIVVIAETPAVGIGEGGKDPYRWAPADYHAQVLTDMIARDKNRCNIIIWSIANETPHSKTRLTFLSNLANKARSLDSVRLIGAAMEKEEVQPGVLTVNDPLGELLDIISFNEYVGWYDGDSEKCDRVNWTFDTQKPVFISELGGGALYGHHGSPKERFTEEYQEDLYIRHVNMLKRIPGLAGTTPWILKDFRSPRRHVPEIQDDFNRKGLVSDKGQKKKAFFVLQKWYKELTEAYK